MMATSDEKTCATKHAKRRLEISIAVKLNMKDVQDNNIKQQDVKDIARRHLTPTTETEKKIIGDFLQERSHTWPRIDIAFKKDNELVAPLTADAAKKSDYEVFSDKKPSLKTITVNEVNEKNRLDDDKVVSRDTLADNIDEHLHNAVDDDDVQQNRLENITTSVSKTDTSEKMAIDMHPVITLDDENPTLSSNDLSMKVLSKDSDIQEIIQTGQKVDIAIPKSSELLQYTTPFQNVIEESELKIPICHVTNNDIKGMDNMPVKYGNSDIDTISNIYDPKLGLRDMDKDMEVADINADIIKNTNLRELEDDQSKLDFTVSNATTSSPIPVTREGLITNISGNYKRFHVNRSTDTGSSKHDDGKEDSYEIIQYEVDERSKDVDYRDVATSPMIRAAPVTIDYLNDTNMTEKHQPPVSLKTLIANELNKNEGRDVLKDCEISTDKKVEDKTFHPSDQSVHNRSATSPLKIKDGTDTVERALLDRFAQNSEPPNKNKNSSIGVREVFRRILPTCKITYLEKNEVEDNCIPNMSDELIGIDHRSKNAGIYAEADDTLRGTTIQEMNKDGGEHSEKTLNLTKVKKHLIMYDDLSTINQYEDFAKNPLDFDLERDETHASAFRSLK